MSSFNKLSLATGIGILLASLASVCQADSLVEWFSCDNSTAIHNVRLVFNQSFGLDFLEGNVFGGYDGPFNFLLYNDGEDASCVPINDTFAFRVEHIGSWDATSNAMTFSNYTIANSTELGIEYCDKADDDCAVLANVTQALVNTDEVTDSEEDQRMVQKMAEWVELCHAGATPNLERRFAPLIVAVPTIISGIRYAYTAYETYITVTEIVIPFVQQHFGNDANSGTAGQTSNGDPPPPPPPPPPPGPGTSEFQCNSPALHLDLESPPKPAASSACTLVCENCVFHDASTAWNVQPGSFAGTSNPDVKLNMQSGTITGTIELNCQLPPKVSRTQKWSYTVFDSSAAVGAGLSALTSRLPCSNTNCKVNPYFKLEWTTEVSVVGAGKIRVPFTINLPQFRDISFYNPSFVSPPTKPVFDVHSLQATIPQGQLKSSIKFSAGAKTSCNSSPQYDFGVSMAPGVTIEVLTEELTVTPASSATSSSSSTTSSSLSSSLLPSNATITTTTLSPSPSPSPSPSSTTTSAASASTAADPNASICLKAGTAKLAFEAWKYIKSNGREDRWDLFPDYPVPSLKPSLEKACRSTVRRSLMGRLMV